MSSKITLEGTGISSRDLLQSIDLLSVVYSNPELFNFNKLPASVLISFLRADFDFFIDKIDPKRFTYENRLYFIINSSARSAPKLMALCDFSEDELRKITASQYSILINYNAKKYLRKDIVSTMSKRYQQELFLKNPKWFHESVGYIPKLSSNTLTELARLSPKFVDENIVDYSKLCTQAYFWNKMIRYDKKYIEIFLKNTNSLINKSDVRVVVQTHSEIVKLVDIDILENSKLSCKEWMLLISSVMSNNPTKFSDFEFSEEMKEAFRLNSMAEMLSEKSKSTKRFRNVIKHLTEDAEEEPAEVV